MPNRRQRAWRVVPLAIQLALATRMLAVVAVCSDLRVRDERRPVAGVAAGVRPWMTMRYAARGIADKGDNRRAPLRASTGPAGGDPAADIAALNAVVDARRGASGARPGWTP